MLYTDRGRAIQDVIVNSIEAGDATASDFDIDAIADEVLAFDEAVDENGVTHRNDQGFYCTADEETFWEIVFKYMY